MITSYMRSLALGAAVLLGSAACAGDNVFTDLPVGANEPLTGGAIRGQVTANGVGVGGVLVIVTDGPRTTTAGDGTYRFVDLPSARYTLSIQVPPGYELAPGEPLLRDAEVADNRVAVASWRLQRNDAPAP